MSVEPNLTNEDLFKKSFKYYKANKPKPSLDKVIEVHYNRDFDKVTSISRDAKKDPRTSILGLHCPTRWKAFAFTQHPGLILIQNPFTSYGQRYWIRRCLQDYPKKPNRTNIDYEVNIDDWWSECFVNGNCNRQLQKKLRWSTLGYHHNWDTKIYSDSNKSLFPEDLAELCDVVAQYLGNRFEAQAAIVNYYHMDSTLSAHTDHSEVNLVAPLFSFSFGQSAVFLIGGKEKSTAPSAILLNSGDILIMSKEARLCYHAVPKILPATSTPWNVTETQNYMPSNFKYITDANNFLAVMKMYSDDGDWNIFNEYVNQSRINMNVRQVLNENQSSLRELNFNQT